MSITEVKTYGMSKDLCGTASTFSSVYGLSSGGTTIQIAGTGFQRVTSVLFDHSPCAMTSKTNKLLQCVNPSHRAALCLRPVSWVKQSQPMGILSHVDKVTSVAAKAETIQKIFRREQSKGLV